MVELAVDVDEVVEVVGLLVEPGDDVVVETIDEAVPGRH